MTITREEYRRTLVRMFDSVRDEESAYEGWANCNGVACDKCPLNVCHCDDDTKFAAQVFDIIETVEKWGKEHPIVTNADKFKEVFGYDIHGEHPNGFSNFWDREYEGPKANE